MANGLWIFSSVFGAYNEELVLLYEELMKLCLLSWLFNISSVIDPGTLVVTLYRLECMSLSLRQQSLP